LLNWSFDLKREGCKAGYDGKEMILLIIDLFESPFLWNVENLLKKCPSLKNEFHQKLFHLEFTPAQ
jgi:hypothetical protein